MKILQNGKAIIIGDEKLNLDEFLDLLVIGCPMTSLEHLPVEEIKKRGIKLFSLRDFPFFLKSVTSTAEHTLGLILSLSRHYKTALNGPYLDREEYKGHTLSEKTLGIIGKGRVGSQVERAALGFKMKVKSFTKGYPTQYLLDVLYLSDIVTLHIPLENNIGFFTKEMFEKMKRSAFLINTSRDKIIQEGALLWALQNNIIAGAAVDFIDDRELLEYARTHDNLILTNHIGGMTFEDRQKTDFIILKAVEAFISNK